MVYLEYLPTMVINHLLSGMILQVESMYGIFTYIYIDSHGKCVGIPVPWIPQKKRPQILGVSFQTRKFPRKKHPIARWAPTS